MAVDKHKLGPGIIEVGEVGAEVDFSCQLTGGVVEWDKTQDDDVTVLCGDVVAGDSDYTAQLSGNVYQDLGLPDGIVFHTWEHRGETVPIRYTPNSDVGAVVEGQIVLDPINVGGDEGGADMRSDFTWTFVGEPVLTPPVAP